MSKKDSFNINLMFGKDCICLTFVEQGSIVDLVSPLICNTLAFVFWLRTSLAKRYIVIGSVFATFNM